MHTAQQCFTLKHLIYSVCTLIRLFLYASFTSNWKDSIYFKVKALGLCWCMYFNNIFCTKISYITLLNLFSLHSNKIILPYFLSHLIWKVYSTTSILQKQTKSAHIATENNLWKLHSNFKSNSDLPDMMPMRILLRALMPKLTFKLI